MSDVSLTKRQREVLAYIERHSAERGYPPTVRDIGRGPGARLPVHRARAPGEARGRRSPAARRRQAACTRGAQGRPEPPRLPLAPRPEPGALPLVGRVAAGRPILAENVEQYVDVPALAGGDHGEFVLEVAGDSMRDAGILGGDHVVVQPQDAAEDGGIRGRATWTTRPRSSASSGRRNVRLQPENAGAAAPSGRGTCGSSAGVVGVLRRVSSPPSRRTGPEPTHYVSSTTFSPMSRRATRCVPASRRLGVPAGGRLTFEQRLNRVWEGLLAAGAAACPVCRGLMQGGAAGAVLEMRLTPRVRPPPGLPGEQDGLPFLRGTDGPRVCQVARTAPGSGRPAKVRSRIGGGDRGHVSRRAGHDEQLSPRCSHRWESTAQPPPRHLKDRK